MVSPSEDPVSVSAPADPVSSICTVPLKVQPASVVVPAPERNNWSVGVVPGEVTTRLSEKPAPPKSSASNKLVFGVPTKLSRSIDVKLAPRKSLPSPSSNVSVSAPPS